MLKNNQKRTISLQGIYNCTDPASIKCNLEDAENISQLLETYGLEVKYPKISLENWANDLFREQHIRKNKQYIRDATDILFLRQKQNGPSCDEYVYAIEQQKKIWTMNDLELLLKTYTNIQDIKKKYACDSN